ncbi:hypothetical protein HY256_12120, partial [Candidatus Sumerlaeota bacterium]|nr:hypothetical protein [Candidatus Sumerlaeota bacterium]
MISLMIRLLIRGFGVIAEAIVDSFPEHHRGMVRMVLLSLLLLMIGG